jgi:CspA family cold shock protein
MPVGKVKWYDGNKGFGFIINPGGGDVFVHYTVIEGEGYRCLRDGEEVEYEYSEGPKGLLATRVKRLKFSASRAPGRRNQAPGQEKPDTEKAGEGMQTGGGGEE